jgi:hypothetical protein
MKFNSKKKAMLFNSKKAETGAKKSFLTLLAYKGHNFFKEDPEQSVVPEAAENAANHYLHGCHHACDEKSTCKGGKKPCVSHCDSNCGGSYLDQGEGVLNPKTKELEPSQDAQKLFGLRKTGSNWSYDKDRSAIRNYLSLTDALKLKIRNKSFGDKGTVEERFNTPSREIGFSDKGDKIATGQYQTTDRNGKTTSHFAHPALDLASGAQLREGFFHSAINRGGSAADLIKAHEQTMAVVHGIEDTKPDGTKKWRHLQEGAKPFMLQKSIKGVLSNIFKHSEYDGDERLRPAYDKARTAEWVMCACPECSHTQAMHPANSVFDIQDHNKAATHNDKSIRDAYHSGFVMGAGRHLGEGSDARVSSRLGSWGSRTPHRGLYMKKSILRYPNSILRGRAEEQDKRYAGHDFAIPTDLAPIDTSVLREKAERQNRNDIVSDYGSD